MDENIKKVFAYIDAHKDEQMAFWKKIVEAESFSSDVEGVKKCSEIIKEAYEAEGFKCSYIDVGVNAPTLVGMLGEDRPGKPIVLAGHMDTVHAPGSFGENKFEISADGKTVHGPGVNDMKGGIAIGLAVVKALNSIGYKGRPVKMMFTGDEENFHVNSRGKEVYRDEAKGAACAINLEPTPAGGQLCVGRKGMLKYKVKITGKDAHAGRNYSEGRSAIREAAYKTLAVTEITDLDADITANVGVIKGGTVANAVPAYCEFEVDMRYVKNEQMEPLKNKFLEVCGKTYVEGTSTECEFVVGGSVFETTDRGLDFYNFIAKVAEKYDLTEGRDGGVFMGGSSDAAYTTMAGTPTICSCGVRGDYTHTKREIAYIDTAFEKAKLVAAMMLHMDEFDK